MILEPCDVSPFNFKREKLVQMTVVINLICTTTVLRLLSQDHPGEPCQKRTSGLYGARED